MERKRSESARQPRKSSAVKRAERICLRAVSGERFHTHRGREQPAESAGGVNVPRNPASGGMRSAKPCCRYSTHILGLRWALRAPNRLCSTPAGRQAHKRMRISSHSEISSDNPCSQQVSQDVHILRDDLYKSFRNFLCLPNAWRTSLFVGLSAYPVVQIASPN